MQKTKAMIPLLESIYESFTPLEKNIADFYLHEQGELDLSARTVAKKLYVSEASLSRFAQKCGFKGYREFLFYYEQSKKKEQEYIPTGKIAPVLHTYQELLDKTSHIFDEVQIERLVQLFSTKKRIYVYGRGSSGFVAQEMKLRFMRLGVNIEAITDDHVMRINTVLLDKTCLVIGISVSGTNEDVIECLKAASIQEATTVFISARKDKSFEFCDEILLVASKQYLENGKAISPQFPVLIMIDILYSYFLSSDKYYREALHSFTLDVLHERKKLFQN